MLSDAEVLEGVMPLARSPRVRGAGAADPEGRASCRDMLASTGSGTPHTRKCGHIRRSAREYGEWERHPAHPEVLAACACLFVCLCCKVRGDREYGERERHPAHPEVRSPCACEMASCIVRAPLRQSSGLAQPLVAQVVYSMPWGAYAWHMRLCGRANMPPRVMLSRIAHAVCDGIWESQLRARCVPHVFRMR